MPRIIFLDVDGTLVDYRNQLPESAVQAIQLARKAGHRVYLTTGRSLVVGGVGFDQPVMVEVRPDQPAPLPNPEPKRLVEPV